jgi:hypothetical protein
MKGRLYTIAIELRTGEQVVYVCRGDSASHAKNRLQNRLPGGRESLQCVRNSREYVAATDSRYEKIGE